MLAPAKDYSNLSALPAGEISLGTLLEDLRAHADKELVFVYGGREVLSGYHVTEIKSGQFESLDCGANPEVWRETFIQLWDVGEDGRPHMKVEKFLAILRKVDEALPLEAAAKLTFEVSDGVSPMQLYKVADMSVQDTQVRVALSQRAASCKPRDRWLEGQKDAAPACESDASQQPCCG